MILIDTHVWIWLNLSPNMLSQSALMQLQSTSRVAISTLSIYETMNAVIKGRIASSQEPEVLVRRWLASFDVLRIPPSEEIVIQSRTLSFFHSDPFDDMIVSTAVVQNIPLMTADRNLLQLDWLSAIPAR